MQFHQQGQVYVCNPLIGGVYTALVTSVCFALLSVLTVSFIMTLEMGDLVLDMSYIKSGGI